MVRITITEVPRDPHNRYFMQLYIRHYVTIAFLLYHLYLCIIILIIFDKKHM